MLLLKLRLLLISYYHRLSSTRGVGRFWANNALEGQTIVHKQSLAPPMLCLLRGFRRTCHQHYHHHKKLAMLQKMGWPGHNDECPASFKAQSAPIMNDHLIIHFEGIV